jgi:hypothetical protein
MSKPTNFGPHIKDLQCITIKQAYRINRLEDLLNVKPDPVVSRDLVKAIQIVKKYYQELPLLLEKKLDIKLEEAIKLIDDLEHYGYINPSLTEASPVPTELDGAFLDLCQYLEKQKKYNPEKIQDDLEIDGRTLSQFEDLLVNYDLITRSKIGQTQKVFRDKITDFLDKFGDK